MATQGDESAASRTGTDRGFFPLSLPRLAPEAARASNRFFGNGRSLRFTAGGRQWTIRACIARPGAEWLVSITLRVAGHQAVLYLDSPVMALWRDTSLTPEEFLALPGELRAAALEARLEEVTAGFTAATGHPVTIDSCSLEPEASWYADEAVPLRFARDDGFIFSGAVTALPGGLAFLADLFCDAAEPAPGGCRLSAVLTARVRARGPALTPPECAALEPGDILLAPAGPSERPGLAARLVIGSTASFPARYEQGTLTLESGELVMDETMDDMQPAENDPNDPPQDADAPDTGAEAAPVRLDEIPLPLRFDLGGLDITIGELETLAQGHVFTLASPADEPVRILLSGRCVGRGSLVAVGDRIGVRITDLSLGKNGGGNATV